MRQAGVLTCAFQVVGRVTGAYALGTGMPSRVPAAAAVTNTPPGEASEAVRRSGTRRPGLGGGHTQL